MRKARPILLVLLAVVLGGFAGQVLRPHEPVFEGRGLSVWLRQYIVNSRWDPSGREPRRLRDEAEIAIRRIGPDALPIFLKMAAEKDSVLRKEMIQLLPPRTAYSLHLWDTHDHHWMAGYGLRALGPVGKAAVPVLVAQLNDRDLEMRASAVGVLGALGPVARDSAPAVMQCLSDPDLGLRSSASNALKQIAPETALKMGVR
jgi:hypothetical protein